MIRAGIIGTGIGLKHLEAINNYRNSKVICILESNKKKIKQLKKKFKDIDIFYEPNKFFNKKGLNLISIASYDEHHFYHIIKSINKNCHIIVEKPVCLTQIHLKKIYNELKKKPKIKFISNLVLRHNSLFNKFKKNLDKKNIYHIDASYLWGRKEKLFAWRSKTKKYSLSLGATIHILDLVCWLLKSKPISVFTKVSKKITKNSKFKKFSFASYIFTFPDNIIVNLKADAVCVHPHFHVLRIFEKEKTVVSDLNRQYKIKKIGINNFKFTKTNYSYPDKANRNKLIRGFIDSIIDKNQVSPSINETFNLMMACFYADLSAETGKEMKIKYIK